jgi:hypothetical protein
MKPVTEDLSVNLFIFQDSPSSGLVDFHRSRVYQDESALRYSTWHWPERE